MSLTKIGSIGINTGIAFAGVTTIVTLNTANDALSIGATVNVGSGITLGASGDIFATGVSTVTTLKVGSGVTVSSDGDIFATGVCTATSFSGDGSNLTGLSGVSVANQSDNRVITNTGTTDALNAEANLTFDGSTLSLSGNLKLPDNTSGNANIYFGTGDDLYINHNGTDSFIINNTGDLYLRDLNGDVHIQAKDSEESVVAKADGAVELYYNNGKKLETTSSGVAVTGELDIADSEYLDFGNGGLKIRTNSNNAYITEATSGKLAIQGSNIEIANSDGDETYIYCTDDGAVSLYHNNGIRLATTSTGINVTQAGSGSISNFSHGGGAGGVRIAGPAAASGANLIFANNYDNSVSDEWAISLDGSTDDLKFIEGGAGGTERIRFLDTGGITFGGDTATSNALNDYEEGTITFAPVNTGVSFSSTYKGRYTKIGELVTVSGYLVVSSVTGSGNTLNVQLPFTSAANGQGYYARGVGATFARYMNFPSNYHNMVAYVGGGEAYIRFFMTRNTGGSSDWHQMTHNNITSNTAIYFNVCYTVVT